MRNQYKYHYDVLDKNGHLVRTSLDNRYPPWDTSIAALAMGTAMVKQMFNPDTHHAVAVPVILLDCMVCGVEYYGPEPQMCCSGRECGCMGMPIDPIICSEECYNIGMHPKEKILTPLNFK